MRHSMLYHESTRHENHNSALTGRLRVQGGNLVLDLLERQTLIAVSRRAVSVCFPLPPAFRQYKLRPSPVRPQRSTWTLRAVHISGM